MALQKLRAARLDRSLRKVGVEVMEKSIMNPYDAEDIRRELCAAIIRRWPIPSIETVPFQDDYKVSESLSTFRVNSFGKTFLVTVEEI